MTLIEALTAHKGRLILLKTELFWYGGRGWDGARGRVCLLMDATAAHTAAATTTRAYRTGDTSALLLVDGQPHWIWVSQADVELL
jgi:hypothetical protein